MSGERRRLHAIPARAVTPAAVARLHAAPAMARLLAAALVAAGGIGCGGGSPSDVVVPQQVNVSVAPLEARAPGSIVLELASTSGRNISVALAAVELRDAVGVAFELDYDPAFLEFVGASAGSFFGIGSVFGAAVTETTPGRLVGISAAADAEDARSGSGALLTLQFRVQQLRDAETTLIFEAPESLVYGPAGALRQRFTGARVVTRISAAP